MKSLCKRIFDGSAKICIHIVFKQSKSIFYQQGILFKLSVTFILTLMI